MKFDLETTGLYRIQRNGHFLIRECLIYRNQKDSVFGLIRINIGNEICWSIIHVPSERAIISKFTTKEEVEEYWDILAAEVDLDSILLCNPKFESIQEQIRYDVEIAYKKYRINKESNCEKNNHF